MRIASLIDFTGVVTALLALLDREGVFDFLDTYEAKQMIQMGLKVAYHKRFRLVLAPFISL